MKIRNFFLIGAVSTALYVFCVSFNCEPNVYLWNWFGYNFGLNTTHHIVPKILAFIFVVLYFLNPTKKFDTTKLSVPQKF